MIFFSLSSLTRSCLCLWLSVNVFIYFFLFCFLLEKKWILVSYILLNLFIKSRFFFKYKLWDLNFLIWLEIFYAWRNRLKFCMGGNLKYLNCRLWSATDDMRWIIIFKGNRDVLVALLMIGLIYKLIKSKNSFWISSIDQLHEISHSK